MVVALLYAMQLLVRRPCDDTLIKYQDDGDHGVMPVTMEIMTVLWRWRSKAQYDDGHIISLILITCDVYPLCILFCLVRR